MIVSQFLETRLPLVQAVTASGRFSEVRSVHNLEEARRTILEGTLFESIFLANKFSQGDLAGFMEAAKVLHQDRQLAFILVLSPEEQNSATVANYMMLGIHGFLNEPFSVGQVDEAIKLGTAVRNRASKVRLRAATGLMLSDVMEADENELPKPNLWETVNKNCEQYKLLTGESVSTAVVEELQNLSPAERVPRYNGVSKRVKKLFEGPLANKLKFGR